MVQINPDDIVPVFSIGEGSSCLFVPSFCFLCSGILAMDLGRGDLRQQLPYFVPARDSFINGFTGTLFDHDKKPPYQFLDLM